MMDSRFEDAGADWLGVAEIARLHSLHGDQYSDLGANAAQVFQAPSEGLSLDYLQAAPYRLGA